MREVRHLRAGDARRVPWKNGRGVTLELALAPEGATFERGDFDWRISRAAVDEDGAFSCFPGYDRLLVVTRGAGLVLDHDDGASRCRLRALEPHRFSGDWTTRAALVAGPVRDFNVVFRRDAVDASIEVLRLGRRRALEAADAPDAFLGVLAGGCRARVSGEEEPYELYADESLWLREARAGDALEIAGTTDDCAVLLVRIAPPRGGSRARGDLRG